MRGHIARLMLMLEALHMPWKDYLREKREEVERDVEFKRQADGEYMRVCLCARVRLNVVYCGRVRVCVRLRVASCVNRMAFAQLPLRHIFSTIHINIPRSRHRHRVLLSPAQLSCSSCQTKVNLMMSESCNITTNAHTYDTYIQIFTLCLH